MLLFLGLIPSSKLYYLNSHANSRLQHSHTSCMQTRPYNLYLGTARAWEVCEVTNWLPTWRARHSDHCGASKAVAREPAGESGGNVPRLDSNTGGGRYTPSEPSQHVCIKYFKCSLYTCINKNNNSFSYKKACASSVRKLNYERVTKKVKLKVWNIWNIPTERQGWGWRWEEGDEEGVRARGHFMHPTKIKIERDESMKLENLRENSAQFSLWVEQLTYLNQRWERERQHIRIHLDKQDTVAGEPLHIADQPGKTSFQVIQVYSQ